MLDAIARTPPQYFLGAGFACAILALMVARGFGPRQGLRLIGQVRLLLLATIGGLGAGGAVWLVAPFVPLLLTRVSPAEPRTCAQARAMGYGTARIGERGYFAHLDADGDGISCEPKPASAR